MATLEGSALYGAHPLLAGDRPYSGRRRKKIGTPPRRMSMPRQASHLEFLLTSKSAKKLPTVILRIRPIGYHLRKVWLEIRGVEAFRKFILRLDQKSMRLQKVEPHSGPSRIGVTNKFAHHGKRGYS